MMLSDNINDFVLERLVCPVSKKPLYRSGDNFIAPCGLRYKNGDFRIGLDFHQVWEDGQRHYEHDAWKELADPNYNFQRRDDEEQEVFSKIKIAGDVVDVGGWYGILPNQTNMDISRYVSIDPMVCLWSHLPSGGAFIRHYAKVQSAPRILGCAEFLPFGDATFDVVHLRSCLDHVLNARLTLTEAYRVLRPGGKVVVMLALEGAYKKINPTPRQRMKNALIAVPGGHMLFELLIPDHHVFHPTYGGLVKLIEDADFKIVQEVWPTTWHNVIYVEAQRP